MGRMMADVNVAHRLDEIEKHVERQDEILTKLSDVAVKQAEMTQQLINTDEKISEHQRQNEKQFDRMDVRFSKMDERVTLNHSTILKWGGGISALIILVGIISSLKGLMQ